MWIERTAEAESSRGPSAYQPNAVTLGQTGSLDWLVDDRFYIALLSALDPITELSVHSVTPSQSFPTPPWPTTELSVLSVTPSQSFPSTPWPHHRAFRPLRDPPQNFPSPPWPHHRAFRPLRDPTTEPSVPSVTPSQSFPPAPWPHHWAFRPLRDPITELSVHSMTTPPKCTESHRSVCSVTPPLLHGVPPFHPLRDYSTTTAQSPTVSSAPWLHHQCTESHRFVRSVTTPPPVNRVPPLRDFTTSARSPTVSSAPWLLHHQCTESHRSVRSVTTPPTVHGVPPFRLLTLRSLELWLIQSRHSASHLLHGASASLDSVCMPPASDTCSIIEQRRRRRENSLRPRPQVLRGGGRAITAATPPLLPSSSSASTRLGLAVKRLVPKWTGVGSIPPTSAGCPFGLREGWFVDGVLWLYPRLHNEWNTKMAFVAAHLRAEIILLVTV